LQKAAKILGVTIIDISDLPPDKEVLASINDERCPIHGRCPFSGELGKDKAEILEWLFKPENSLDLRELQVKMERSKNRNGGTNGRCNEKPMAKMA